MSFLHLRGSRLCPVALFQAFYASGDPFLPCCPSLILGRRAGLHSVEGWYIGKGFYSVLSLPPAFGGLLLCTQGRLRITQWTFPSILISPSVSTGHFLPFRKPSTLVSDILIRSKFGPSVVPPEMKPSWVFVPLLKNKTRQTVPFWNLAHLHFFISLQIYSLALW